MCFFCGQNVLLVDIVYCFCRCCYRDEPCHLSLSGFLKMVKDESVQAPEKMLQSLRLLRHRHPFSSTHRICLPMFTDLKTTVLTTFQSFAPMGPKPAKPPLVVCFDLTLEEQINRWSVMEAVHFRAEEVVVEKEHLLQLVDAQKQWRSAPRHRAHWSFLSLFVESSAIFIAKSRRSPASPSAAAQAKMTPPASQALPDILSSLVHRCLSDLGGGFSQLSAGLPAPVNTRYFTAEKAFVATCIKQFGLIHKCLSFSRSLDAVKLLENAGNKGTRCMHQPLCPRWLQKLVKLCFRYVRKPLIGLLRQTKSKILAARAQKENWMERKEQKEQKEHKEATKISLPKPADDGLLIIAFVEKILRNSLFLLNDFNSEALSAASSSLGQETFKEMSKPGSGEDSSDDDDDNEAEPLHLQRARSEIRTSPSKLKLSLNNSGKDRKKKPNANDDDTIRQIRAKLRLDSSAATTDVSPFSLRSPLSSWTAEITGFSEFDNYEMGGAAEEVDMKWIGNLVSSDQSLGRSLTSSIRKLRTAMLLREGFLKDVNQAFSSGQAVQVVDDLLPIALQAHVISDSQVSFHAVFFFTFC